MTSGSWAGGNAAGTIGIDNIIGNWQQNSNLGDRIRKGTMVCATFGRTADYSLNWGITLYGTTKNCTVQNNYVHDQWDSGNHSANSANIMLFSYSSNNIIENNTTDGKGIINGGIGSKGGFTDNNIIRYNLIKNAINGVWITSSTSETDYSNDNTVYQNIFVNCSNAAVGEPHAVRRTTVYNNTAYNVLRFFGGWKDNLVGNQLYNNIAVGSRGITRAISFSGYNAGDCFTFLAPTVDYNCFNGFTSWWYRAMLPTQAWDRATFQSNCSFDAHSMTSDPKFVNPSGGDFHLRSDSPCRNAGKNGITIGAYITGNETIGYTPPGGLSDTSRSEKRRRE